MMTVVMKLAMMKLVIHDDSGDEADDDSSGDKLVM